MSVPCVYVPLHRIDCTGSSQQKKKLLCHMSKSYILIINRHTNEVEKNKCQLQLNYSDPCGATQNIAVLLTRGPLFPDGPGRPGGPGGPW